jgi:hypothetical protein
VLGDAKRQLRTRALHSRDLNLTGDRSMRTRPMIGIDATRPFGEPFSEVADVPGWKDFACRNWTGASTSSPPRTLPREHLCRRCRRL